MNCIKCGKKTRDELKFCPTCLAAMELYPVKADVHIQLPNRQKTDATKKSGRKRHITPPEEQVVQLRKSLRTARIFCILLAVLLCVTGAMLLNAVLFHPEEGVDLGKNYTYDSSME